MDRQTIQLNVRKSARQEEEQFAGESSGHLFVWDTDPCLSHGRSAGVKESQVGKHCSSITCCISWARPPPLPPAPAAGGCFEGLAAWEAT